MRKPNGLSANLAKASPRRLASLAVKALVEEAEVIVFMHYRRRARLHPDPYAGLADDELSSIELDDTETRSSLN